MEACRPGSGRAWSVVAPTDGTSLALPSPKLSLIIIVLFFLNPITCMHFVRWHIATAHSCEAAESSGLLLGCTARRAVAAPPHGMPWLSNRPL